MEILKESLVNYEKGRRGRPSRYPFDKLEPGFMIKIKIEQTGDKSSELRKISSSLCHYKKRTGESWESACRIVGNFIHVYRLPEIVDKIIKKEVSEKGKEQKRMVREGITVTVKEDDALISEFGKELVDKSYDFLSLYKQEKNYKTKSDYLTIRRWVIDAVKKQLNGTTAVTTSNAAPAKLGTSAARMEAGKRWVETGSTKPTAGQDLFSK